RVGARRFPTAGNRPDRHGALFAWGGFCVLALVNSVRALVGIGLYGRPCNATGRCPNVDNRRRGSDIRPDRLLDSSSCHSALSPNPSLSSKLSPARDRSFWLSAIGQCLKDQRDALASPIPPHIAALVQQLE